MNDLKHLATQLLRFSIPLAVLVAVVTAVDAYDVLPGPNLVSHQLKHDSAYKLNYALWTTTSYARNPLPNILLGDSRMNALPVDSLEALTGLRWANLAYGGGSLEEALDTFEFARSQTRLQRVAIGISLDLFNDANRRNRVSGALAIRDNPLLYVINRNVLQATAGVLMAWVRGKPPEIGRPNVDKDTFWRRQLDVTAAEAFAAFSEPTRYRRELAELARTCRREGIELRFLIFPTHDDLRARIADAGLSEESANMRLELSYLAPVYDFDWSNEFTSDRENFGDPYHCHRNLLGHVLRGVWGSEQKLVHRYDRPRTAG